MGNTLVIFISTTRKNLKTCDYSVIVIRKLFENENIAIKIFGDDLNNVKEHVTLLSNSFLCTYTIENRIWNILTDEEKQLFMTKLDVGLPRRDTKIDCYSNFLNFGCGIVKQNFFDDLCVADYKKFIINSLRHHCLDCVVKCLFSLKLANTLELDEIFTEIYGMNEFFLFRLILTMYPEYKVNIISLFCSKNKKMILFLCNTRRIKYNHSLRFIINNVIRYFETVEPDREVVDKLKLLIKIYYRYRVFYLDQFASPNILQKLPLDVNKIIIEYI